MARKLTYEEVKNFIEVKSGSGCKLLSEEYLGVKDSLDIQCNCGNNFKVSYNRFKYNNKTRCNECTTNRKTNKEFATEVYELVKNEYTFLDEYVGSRAKIRCKHNTCGNVWSIIPGEFLRGKRCPSCAVKSRTKSDSQFIQDVFNEVGDEYTFLEKYINASTKILCRHNKCGYEYQVKPNNFFSGRRCPKCYERNRGKKRMLTHEEYLERVTEIHSDEYTVLGIYSGMENKIVVKHNSKECDFSISNINANNFIRGAGCHQCAIESVRVANSKTHDQFVSDIRELYEDEYVVIGVYTHDKRKVRMQHNKCGHIWDILPTNILRRFGCPVCASSKGEKAIHKHLIKNNITFFKEHMFEGCVNDRHLPFDFYLPTLNVCIEYDGEHHFEPVNFGGVSDVKALENHRRTVKNDGIKNQYCKDNGIQLLRIPYWDFDSIDDVLDRELSLYTNKYKI